MTAEQRSLVYKMFSGRYDATVTNWFTNRHIDKKYEVRSHRFCIHQFPIKFDMRKFNFTNRVISVWNTLPDTVVSANTIDTFKALLDIGGSRKLSWEGALLGPSPPFPSP